MNIEATAGEVTQGESIRKDLQAELQKGLALQKAGKLDAAERIYQDILTRNPLHPDALHLSGLIAADRQDSARARKLISKALELRPENGVIHNNMAGTLARLGDMELAETHYREAVHLLPKYVEALFNLSGIVKFTSDDPLFEQAAALLSAGGWSDKDLCFLHFALGKMFDDIGDHDRAFAHYLQGNAAKGAYFSPQYQHGFVKAQIKAFPATLIKKLKGLGTESDLPVFVVGMPRSGTTLVEQILASHPQVHGAGELPDIGTIASTIPKHLPDGASYPAGISKAPEGLLKGFGESYLKRVRELAPDAKRIVDKMPVNFNHLGLIATMFPNAQIIHCRRDALDTCLSCYFQNFANGQNYAFDLVHLGLYYRWYERLMAHWNRVLPGRIFEVSYEELVAKPKKVAPALVGHCGLEWDPACIEFHKSERPIKTASRWQVRQPLYKTSIKRAKPYKKHLAPLIEILDAD